MEKYSVFIRTDADAEIGLGHLMRCLAIEEHLSDDGEITVTFLIKESSIDNFKKNTRSKVVVIQNSEDEQSATANVIKILKNSKRSILITDSYLLSDRFYRNLRQVSPTVPVLAIDDYGEKIDFPVTGIINFGISAHNISFPEKLKSFSAIGVDYFPIRKELLKAKKSTEKPSKKGKNLLVTMGGSDPEDQTCRIVKILRKLSFSHHVDLILGPEYGSQARLKELIDSDKQFNVHCNPKNLAQLMSQAKWAITGGGMTCLELIFFGIPVGVISLAKHQKKIASAAEHYNCGLDFGYFDLISDARISSSIIKLIKTPWFDKNRKQNHSLIDGNGGTRIARYIKDLLSKYHNDRYTLNSVAKEYTSSSRHSEPYAKVKWGSEAGMINRINLTMRQINWKDISTWVDVGCGTASLLKAVEKEKSISRFVGLEIAKPLYEFALAQKFKTKNVSFYNQNFIDFIPEEPFDLVTCIGVIQKCGVSLWKSVARLAELTRPDGQCFVTTKNLGWSKFTEPGVKPYSGHHWFRVEDIRLAFSLAGLKILKFAGFEPRVKGKICPQEESHSLFVLAQKRLEI